MYETKTVAVIVPALNEKENIRNLLRAIPRYVDRIIVCDNGSADGTFEILLDEADRDVTGRLMVVREENRGYGAACLRAMRALGDEEITVFLDADLSDDPEMMPRLLDPIRGGEKDFVVSNRFTPRLEQGAMSRPQKWGNRLAVWLIRLFWGFPYRDLGPFRSIRTASLMDLDMRDQNYGWTVEMQIRAVEAGLRIGQVDVPYRNRLRGRSKVSRTVRGVVFAGSKILLVIAARALFRTHRGKGCR